MACATSLAYSCAVVKCAYRGAFVVPTPPVTAGGGWGERARSHALGGRPGTPIKTPCAGAECTAVQCPFPPSYDRVPVCLSLQAGAGARPLRTPPRGTQQQLRRAPDPTTRHTLCPPLAPLEQHAGAGVPVQARAGRHVWQAQGAPVRPPQALPSPRAVGGLAQLEGDGHTGRSWSAVRPTAREACQCSGGAGGCEGALR